MNVEVGCNEGWFSKDGLPFCLFLVGLLVDVCSLKLLWIDGKHLPKN